MPEFPKPLSSGVRSSTGDPVSPTGIAGLDHILGGGLPENRLHLLLGSPGVGKTTVALQYLLEGAGRGETGMYIALSETREEIESVARSHHWPIDRLTIFELSALEQQLAQEEENTVFHPSEIELNRTTETLLKRIEEVKPKRLVLDSLSELRLLSDTPLRYRRQMLSFKQYFTGRQMTVILLDDHSAEGGDVHVQSIAHGVIALEQQLADYGAQRRRIVINKMRGVNFLGGFHDVAIETGGLRVFPRLAPELATDNVPRPSQSSGIAALDGLLGGGLDGGTSCLLLGPAGTGKSTIALQFALSAARRGESVLVCLFEENRRNMLARAASVGMPVEDFMKSGHITLMSINPAEMSPGAFIHAVLQHIDRNATKILVIDSLNGFMQAMPDAKFLNVQLHDLLTYLNTRGVLSIMTVAQHGFIGVMQTPVDLTYLADTVILLRFFEQGGQIKKAISVIKKRIGPHEDTLREFKIDGVGLRVGPALEEFHGVLTGTPTFRGRSEQMLGGR